MKIIGWRPQSLTESFGREIDALLNFPFANLPARREDLSLPSLDTWEDKDNVYVEADLPGFEEKDIKIKMKGGALTISAERRDSKEEKNLPAGRQGKTFFLHERFHGSFYRALQLPTGVDGSKVSAQYKKGVLKLTLPKKEEAKEKEIDINLN